MNQYLPCGGFKWLNQKEIGTLDAKPIGKNSPRGYIRS